MIKQCFEEELQKWKDYDPLFHFVDGYIMWPYEKAALYYGRREKGLEKVIPEERVNSYKEHFKKCKHVYNDKDCPFGDDKVFFQ